MNSSKHPTSLSIAGVTLAAAAFMAVGCATGVLPTNSSSGASSSVTGASFVVGTDAPMPSVVSFATQIESINAVTATGTSVPLISGTPTVDFARFNGLQTLIDMNDVPVGTYTSVSITLGASTLGYLSQTANAAPTIQTEAATLTQSTISVTLANPLVITQAGAPAGLRMDFDLRKSIQVDGNGQITGMVTPTLDVTAVANSDSGAYLDAFDAAVVSVNANTQSFVVQGPHGRNFTVQVNGQTEWENGESLSSLTTSSIVRIAGTLDKADATIDADDVAIVSQDGFFAGGLITYVTPATGAATSFDFYVRGLLPANTGITLGQIAQVNLTGSESYFINKMHNTLTKYIFNEMELLPGQEVTVGGPATGAANANAVTVKRIALHDWGYNGTVVAKSENAAAGTFQMQISGFAGLLVPQTVTVVTDGPTAFRDGLTGIGSLTDGESIRAVGLLIKDPVTGQTALLARYVDALK